MEGNCVVNVQRVLVVDGMSETEEVLRAVLEPRGLQVERIRRRATTPDPSPDKPAPSLVVLEEDHTVSPSADVAWRGTPRVIIGTADVAARRTAADPDASFLPKPFRYQELIHAIDRLLDRSPPGAVDPAHTA